jgi:predicted transcriptional regulator
VKAKRKHTRLNELDAIQIVTQYHLGQCTQTALAKRFGVASGYVSRLVHGQARPHIRELVEAQLARLAGQS